MIGMNGFTLGFFFPKQDFSKSVTDTQRPVAREDARQKKTTEPAGDEERDDLVPFLYAYRFF